jgi:uncharacterized protein (DUF427 family)
MPEIAPGRALESVWDYPRPPRVERSDRRVRVIVEGRVIAESTRAIRVLETSHPPVWYVPPEDVRLERLEATTRRTVCEFKGEASYYRIGSDASAARDVAWTYHAPLSGYESIRDYIAFYPGRVDEALIDDEHVEAQAGDFYGGWITSEITGPFKGGAGTTGW